MATGEDKNHSKILKFTTETSSPKHDSNMKKYQATAKYDRKALNQRLALEEWMHYELRKLYECKDDEDYDVEIDIDILQEQENDTTRSEMLVKLLQGTKSSSEAFIKELLEKIQSLEPHIFGKSSSSSSSSN